MSITLTELLAASRIVLADSQCSQSTFFSDADLTLYINNSLLTLFSLLPDDALQNYNDVDESNIVSGTSEYDLPDDYYIESTVMVSDVQARKVRYSEYVIWENNTYLQPLKSQPAYTIKDGQVVIFPEPEHDAALGLKFFYLKVPPTLEDGSDTVDIDASYSPIITKLAAGRALQIKASVEEGAALVKSALEDLQILLKKDISEEESE